MLSFEKTMEFFSSEERIASLKNISRGIERECLRITTEGSCSERSHPEALGSALTNPYITTDYAEGLLELITPPLGSPEEVHNFLYQIHQFVLQNIDSEMIWPFSMPCRQKDEQEFVIASYGTSNIGKMKALYRRGLFHRYGSFMQAISGIHYNFSVNGEFWGYLGQLHDMNLEEQELKNQFYMGMSRNIRRFGLIVPYLFGGSPAVCESYFSRRPNHLGEIVPFNDTGTLYGPYSTSLRMSRVGYRSVEQEQVYVSYNNLEEYLNGLAKATETKYPKWSKISLKNDEGEYNQLNDNLLQIENEFYSLVRPKQSSRCCSKPSCMLKNSGIEYVEYRALDINPFSEVGIELDQIRFLDVFLLYCLLSESPLEDLEDQMMLRQNYTYIVTNGRMPDKRILVKTKHGDGYRYSDQLFNTWAFEIFDQMIPVADLLDKANSTKEYSKALNKWRPVIEDTDKTISGRMIKEMKESGLDLQHYALEKANSYNNILLENKLPPEQFEKFETAAKESILKQKEIEDSDNLSFEDFLKSYFKA